MAARLHMIEIERATVTTDPYGDEQQTWAAYATVLATVRMGSGRERREAAQEAATQTATFVVNWSPAMEAITPQDRIVWGPDDETNKWDIISNAPSREFRKHQEITATKRAG